MIPLLVMLSTIGLFAGFLALTSYETARGSRIWSVKRTWLDRHVERMVFIYEHVDFAAFIREEVQNGVRQGAHMIVHLSLQLVRAIERMLTRVVRTFRVEEAQSVPRESARAFVKTLSDFKVQLRATPPEVPEIQ